MDTTTDVGNFTAEQHVALRSARITHYETVMAITFAVSIANLFLIFMFAPKAPIAAKLAIALSVVSIGCFGALGGRSTLLELKAINQDHIDAKTGTHYARYLANIPIDLFTSLTVGLLVLISLVQLFVLFTV